MSDLARQERELAAAAVALGLHQEDAKTLIGERAGIRVRVKLWEADSDDGTSYWTTVNAAQLVPLRMTFRLARHSAIGRAIRRALGDPLLLTGHQEFDEAFRVHVRDKARGLALLAQPALRQALLSVLPSRNNGIEISDVTCGIWSSGWCTNADQLRAMLEDTYRVARAVTEAHRHVPPSDAEQRAARAVSEAAGALGFVFDAAQLRAEGQRGKQRVSVTAVYQPSGVWTTDFQATFPATLGLGLRLLKQDGFWSRVGEFFGAQDIEVGHARFDATFKVKGKPEDRVASLLEGDVAERILALHAVAKELTVGDEGVLAIADGLMDDAPSLVRSVDVVSALAGAIAARAWREPPAYR